MERRALATIDNNRGNEKIGEIDFLWKTYPLTTGFDEPSIDDIKKFLEKGLLNTRLGS